MSDGDFESRSTSTAAQLLRAIGGWGRPSASGRGILLTDILAVRSMFHLTIVASTSAALVGLGCATVCGVIFSSGTLGFVAGSCIGYIAGSVGYYHSALAQSFLCLEEHPRLMHLHLINNYPLAGFQKWQIVAKDGQSVNLSAMQRFRESWALKGLLISAWTTAAPALEDYHIRQQAAIMNEYGT